LLFIDFIFFLVELITGYAVGSLALVADSFHMLNDIMSLIVALYAIKLTAQDKEKHIDTRYSYGWHRAEILAALVNGVFLLALCFSIFMEAIERFFSTPEISNPKLIVVVGSLGLASNIFGLFLFHDHDHSHDHGHSHGKVTDDAEYPDAVANSDSASTTFDDRRGRTREEDDSYIGHPAITRQAVVQAAQDLQQARSPSLTRAGRATSPSTHRRSTSYFSTDKSRDAERTNSRDSATEATPLLGDAHDSAADAGHAHESTSDTTATMVNPKTTSGGHKPSKAGSMNMRALVLHVLGDALGNVGVIATGLVIWLTELSWKGYFDPIISLFITVIIFSSALPLVKSASFILLQGVPAGISLGEVEETVRRVDGVEEVHELHIWQLSETKLIASMHVRTNPHADFMQVAAEIKKHLHDRGIHSVTIQPEYDSIKSPLYSSGRVSPGKACLLTCQQDCNLEENACCPPPPADV